MWRNQQTVLQRSGFIFSASMLTLSAKVICTVQPLWSWFIKMLLTAPISLTSSFPFASIYIYTEIFCLAKHKNPKTLVDCTFALCILTCRCKWELSICSLLSQRSLLARSGTETSKEKGKPHKIPVYLQEDWQDLRLNHLEKETSVN